MKKLVAFLTLFVMLLDIANAETTDYEIASSYFKDKFEKLSIPSALQGEAYKRVFNEYVNEGVGQLWGNDEYEKLASIRERYCKKGLYEACQRLGEQYMLGVGVERDLDMAIILISYNLINSKYDYLRLRGKEMLNFASSLKKDNMDADAAMKLSVDIWGLMMKECDGGKRDEPYCLMFFVLSDVVPNHLTARKINGKRYLAIDMAFDKMGEDIKRYESGSQPISASQFFPMLEYIAKMIPNDQILGSNANAPRLDPAQSSKPNKDTWYKEGNAYLSDVKSESKVTIKIRFPGDDKHSLYFYTCEQADKQSGVDCVFTGWENDKIKDFQHKLSYFSTRDETPDFKDGRGYTEDTSEVYLTASPEWIKQNGDKPRIYYENAENRYTEELPIFVSGDLVSTATIGDEQSTRGDTDYAVYVGGKLAVLALSDKFIQKLNESSDEPIEDLDEVTEFFLYKDKLYIRMSNIVYKSGKKNERNKFVAFDLNGLERFIVPKD